MTAEERIIVLEDACTRAASWFREYEAGHRQAHPHNTEAAVKAARNCDRAEFLEEVLAKVRVR